MHSACSALCITVFMYMLNGHHIDHIHREFLMTHRFDYATRVIARTRRRNGLERRLSAAECSSKAF